ncbi:SET domain-containing protein [Desarmillaria ectypa]|nr:SET domain-containing protein [Desarmillaria ectypa]
MRKGFLLSSSRKSTETRSSDSFPSSSILEPPPNNDTTRVLSKTPRIVLSDARIPGAPCFLYLPHGKHDMVYIDNLPNVKEISTWRVWDEPIPSDNRDFIAFQPVEGKGMGMIARRTILAGELIIAERPVYAQRKALPRCNAQNAANGVFHLSAVKDLSPTSREAIFSLKNSKTGCHPLPGILQTNFLMLDITEEPDPNPENQFVGIFPLLSRANHDCTPNSHYFFNFSSFTGEFRATRNILRGDEVTISYTHVLAPRALRQAHLRGNYSFICSCVACCLDTKQAEASDERRAQIYQLVEEITPGSSALQKPSYEKMKECLKVVEKERLDIYRAQMLFYGGTLLLQRGDITHFLQWMKRAKEEYLRMEGETSPAFKAVRTT